MSVHRPYRSPVYWAAVAALTVLGGPLLLAMLGASLHGCARLLGWLP